MESPPSTSHTGRHADKGPVLQSDSDASEKDDDSVRSLGSRDDMGRHASSVKVRASFHRSERVRRVSKVTGVTKVREQVDGILSSVWADAASLIIMIFDMLLMIWDIDCRAQSIPTPSWVDLASLLCLLTYTLELLFTIFTKGKSVLKAKLFVVDVSVVFIGYADALLMLTGVSASDMALPRLLRVIKIMRLMRTARKSPALKELRKLLMMFSSCLKTLFWSIVFLFIIQTVWAMVAVEILQPSMQTLAQEGFWEACPLCETSLSSVMRANLTLFKTIVAGDGWGLVAEPFIAEYPWACIIFCGSLLSLVCGVMNLVVAVIVDTAAEQRLKDVTSLAHDLDEDQAADLKFLTSIFNKIDEDDSGSLELEELIQGAQSLPEFQSRLRVMDIDKSDLVNLFQMLDEDGDGTISPEEFKQALSRWLTESKTAARFTKYNVMRLADRQREIVSALAAQNRLIERQQKAVNKLLENKNKDSISATKDRSFGSDKLVDAQVPSDDSRIGQVVSKPVDTQYDTSSVSEIEFAREEQEPKIKSPSRHLLEAAKSAERAVAATLERALQLMHESALEAADATLRDAASKAGLKVQSLSLQFQSRSHKSSDSGLVGEHTGQRLGQESTMEEETSERGPRCESPWRPDKQVILNHDDPCEMQPPLARSQEFGKALFDRSAHGLEREESFGV